MAPLILALLFAESLSLTSIPLAATNAAPSEPASVDEAEPADDDQGMERLLVGGATVALTSGCGSAIGTGVGVAVAGVGLMLAFSIGGGYGYQGVPIWIAPVVMGVGAVLAVASPFVASLAGAWLGDLVSGSMSTWWLVVLAGAAGGFATIAPAVLVQMIPPLAGLALPLIAVTFPVLVAVGATSAWAATAVPDPSREPSSWRDGAGLQELTPPPERWVAMAY